ncbi:MAG TPA: saccharopine dehydrogenase NADP-binding domain-containing protein [Anaerolineaceae bacterium]|nr:saccharopine dehydrogenase NADP-binding domain-containing protein [Anaerolineaceae bacterium]
MKENWLIYGATGYTGRLVAEEAVRRGHRPVLAARSCGKLDAISTELSLDSIVLRLDDADRLEHVVGDFQVVFHTAGPFIRTSQPMLAACLRTGTHYLDITGELKVLERILGMDREAKEAGIVVIPATGFDVTPTDCLSVYVAGKLPGADRLEIGFSGLSHASAGTVLSGLDQDPPLQFYSRQKGRLVAFPPGLGGKKIRFLDRERYAIPIPWGDLTTAYWSTGIENITTYMAMNPKMAQGLRIFGPSIEGMLQSHLLRNALKKIAGNVIQGPDKHTRQTARSQIWAHTRNAQGETAEAWIETLEAYQLTAVSGVCSVEKVLAGAVHPGAFTPAQAFGPDFVLEFPRTRRFDHLPD